MNTRKYASLQRQRGASAILVVLFLAMTSLILLAGFKLYPIYFDHWSIMSVADGLEQNDELAELSVQDISKQYRSRLQINNVRDFDFAESVYIEKVDGTLFIEIDYERRTNIYRNIDAVVRFSESREFDY